MTVRSRHGESQSDVHRQNHRHIYTHTDIRHRSIPCQDIETQEGITAHLLYKRLQEDAKEASLSLCVEGCPRDAEFSDKHTFIIWMLESSGCNDPDVKVSMHNTRGEISNTIVIIFTSGFHRNMSYQWYVDNYIRHKQKLWWWSPSSGTTGKEIRIRKTLSEDARRSHSRTIPESCYGLSV